MKLNLNELDYFNNIKQLLFNKICSYKKNMETMYSVIQLARDLSSYNSENVKYTRDVLHNALKNECRVEQR